MMVVMQPPVRSIPLPQEVCELIVAMMDSAQTGSVTIHFVKGEIRSTDEHRMRRIGEKR